MLDRIEEFVARHNMFPPGARVGVAVSGGADSVFLLHALLELAPRWNLQLSVVHVDHGIRGAQSRADAAFVEDLATQLHLNFHLRQADVPAIDDNLEQAARQVRQAFFAELLSTAAVDRIATGHTRSDQAETVLYRILRGSSLPGLSGVLPVTKDQVVRPLLELDRSEIECWLRQRNIAWREDETNQDRSYARNLLRHDILPLLRDNFNPRLDKTLANMATLAQDEESYWVTELQRRPSPSCNTPQILSTIELAALPTALARRIIRQTIERAKGDLRQIDFDHVERILVMARSQDGHDRIQLAGLDVLRSFEWIRLAATPLAHARGSETPILSRDRQGAVASGFDFSFTIRPPGSVELPDGSARITLQILEKGERAQACGTVVDELDWGRLTSPNGAPSGLEVRNWRPGDRYQRMGQSRKQKIKLLFQESRIPLWDRWNWPIVTYNGFIVWARRFGAAAEFAANPATAVVLAVGESRNRLDSLNVQYGRASFGRQSREKA
jgi:tRNA(Ile)-lysidine synthase